MKSMKDKIFFLIIFLLSVNFFNSQTKDETQKWIKETYEKHRRPENLKNWVEFVNGELVYSSSPRYFERIKISDINKISVKKDLLNDSLGKLSWYSIKLFCKNTDCVKREYVDGKTDKIEEISIILDLSFEEDGLSKRMEKALLHLIKLYGGNASLKKETF